MSTYSSEREVAIKAVIKACHLCRTVQKNLVSEESVAKKDKSPVTVADFGAQAVVSQALAGAFPNVPLVGEEDAAQLREAENAEVLEKVVANVQQIEPELNQDQILAAIDRGTFEGGPTGQHWTLDPIDGTKGFLRNDQYAVALALIENGQVVLGILGCPSLPVDGKNFDGPRGCLFIAEKGCGTTMRVLDDPNAADQPIQVTDIADASQASFCESVESAHSSQSDSAQVAQLLKIAVPPYRIDSQCKYAAVGRGDASIYLRLPTRKGYEEKIWDHAAGSIVITEAGGRVTDVRGKDLDFSIGRTLRDNLGVIVTNGKLHDEVVSAVMQVLDLNG
ncbi:MAG: 3'(2'),5'-bisphosphate nucleotidase [Planctomycetes bacterium]|nr:3'(2'),5'-bisphosphate nucleotidase [Planctomycetota bacterium]NOG54583.1 3'(2'),5'-bisphosphate nucleotidase [Planctomycetota bacterium]